MHSQDRMHCNRMQTIRLHHPSPHMCHASVRVQFSDSKGIVQITTAETGETLITVASRIGHELMGIECGEGKCGSCEVKCFRDGDTESKIIRTCVARIPKGVETIELKEIEDNIWGGA